MKLYNSIGPNPHIVRMFMAEKGIEVPRQPVDLRKGENREAEHLKRNPHGQMPTLELDDGSYLSEITAICEYLEEKHPAPATDRLDAGRARRMPDVDAPRRSQYLRAAGERLPVRRGAEILREADSGRAGSVARPEDDRGQPPAMARRPDGRRPRVSLRQALHARRHAALLAGSISATRSASRSMPPTAISWPGSRAWGSGRRRRRRCGPAWFETRGVAALLP